MVKKKSSISSNGKFPVTLNSLKNIPIDDLALSRPNGAALFISKIKKKFNKKRKSPTNRNPRQKSAASSRKHLYSCPSLLDIPIDDLALSSVSFPARKVKSDKFQLHQNSNLKQKKKEITELKQKEDDLYEYQNFEKFKDLLIDSPVLDRIDLVKTPTFEFEVNPHLGLQRKPPKIVRCFNENTNTASRKIAKYRRNQRKKEIATEVMPVVSEKKSVDEVIADACRIQKIIEDITDKSDSEDSYFSFDS